MELLDAKKRIEDLKNLFSSLVGVAKEINVLHESRNTIDSGVTDGLRREKLGSPMEKVSDAMEKFGAPDNVTYECRMTIESQVTHRDPIEKFGATIEEDNHRKIGKCSVRDNDQNVPHELQMGNDVEVTHSLIAPMESGCVPIGKFGAPTKGTSDTMQEFGALDNGRNVPYECRMTIESQVTYRDPIEKLGATIEEDNHRKIGKCSVPDNDQNVPRELQMGNDVEVTHSLIAPIENGCVPIGKFGAPTKGTSDAMQEFGASDNSRNVFGSGRKDTGSEGNFHLNFDQIEYISEAELGALEGYEVIMEVDLELSPLHIFDGSDLDVPTNQLPPSVETDSKYLHKNLMFDDDGYYTQDNVTVAADEAQPFPISPHQLLMNVDPSRRSCDNTNMVVPTSDEGKKRLFCLYCKTHQSKLYRHLTSVHKNEKAVKDLMEFPKKSKSRLAALDLLNKKGMFVHNGDRKYNKGRLLTCRRQRINRPQPVIKTCAKCLGPLAKSTLRNHFKNCKGIDIHLNGERSVQVLSRMVEGRIHIKASDELQNGVIVHMTEDDIVQLIRFDWLLVTYGNSLCEGLETFQYDSAKQKLRLAGRLLKTLKSIEPEVSDFASMYQREFYKTVVQAIRMVGKFDPASKLYGAPSTSKAAVTLVRAIGVMLVSEYILKKDPESQNETENFNKVFNSGITTAVSKGVYKTQAKMKRDKREKLPSTEDIKLLAKYISKQLKLAYLELSRKYSYACYLNLARMTMASIIVFNRRRTGETQNILLTDYERRESLEEKWLATLSVEDQSYAKQFSRMKIRGKLDRTVPCLIKPDVDKSIRLLMRHRKKANIVDENGYLFGLPTTITGRFRRINACNVLRKLSVLCGAKEPELLRGTKMRKHVASMCITMELSESAVSELAEYMGHRDKIHYKYYRKEPLLREVVHLSKLFQTAQGGDEEDDDEETDDEEQDDADGDYEAWPQQDVGTDCVDAAGTTQEKSEDWAEQDNGVGCVEVAELNEANEGTIEDWPDQNEVDCIETAGRNEASGGKNKITRARWNPKEIADVRMLFSSDLKSMKLPSLKSIDERRNGTLKHRSSQQIKSWLYNNIKKRSKNVNQVEEN